MGTDYSVWDVHTNLNRWWVITNPTNLYSQVLMPSLDYTLSFHIGLMARVQARREIAGGDEILDFLSTTQRKIYQAQLAFDEADAIEDFQAVGLQCREAMTRSEEHTSELQSLMRISYAVFCLKKKNKKHHH